MSKLCEHLFIIIFMRYTRKSKYIPTVTNCVNFSEWLLFSAEGNSSMAFHTKFLRSTRQVLPEKFWTKRQKITLLVVVYEEYNSKFYVAPTFRVLLENCHQLDLDTCVRRLVTKNGEFEGCQ